MVSHGSAASRRNVLRAGVGGIAAAATGTLALSTARPAAATQGEWWYCNRCCGLFFAIFGSLPGKCVSGSPHVKRLRAAVYVLNFSYDSAAGQSNWRYCHMCKCLWFAGGGWFGRCFGNAGNGHTFDGSGDYRLETSISNNGSSGRQQGWRWCHKCASLWFPLSGGRYCVVSDLENGIYHSSRGSGDYWLPFLP
jgi:hypothetical protein